jgi:murein DD-endopeptidase MepM/ murein hydrolase activator NlpD
MSNIIPPLPRFSVPVTNISQSSTPGNPVDFSKSFSDILSAVMMSSAQSSSSGSTSSNSMLLPLMLSLLEKLLEQNLNTADTSANSGTVTPEAPRLGGVSGTWPVGTGSTPSGRPVGGVLTNTFHPGHNGLDFGVPVGTNVQATMSGKVVYAGWNTEGYGNLVIVENGPYRTYFAHLSQIPVKIGDVVAAGDIVGLSGNTGNSTGPHVHYEVRNNQKVIDPTSFTLLKTG